MTRHKLVFKRFAKTRVFEIGVTFCHYDTNERKVILNEFLPLSSGTSNFC